MDEADRHRLGDAQHRAIFDTRISPFLFSGTTSSPHPVAIIFGGQPGAGKSAAVDHAAASLEVQGGSVQILGDAFRSYHPKYAELMATDDKTAAFYTDRDTGRWVEMAIAQSVERRVNVVIEGTMRDSEKVASTMRLYRDAGFEVDARSLAVPFALSEQGILQRYEAQKQVRGAGRMTTAAAHEAAYNGLPATLERIESEGLADRLALYRRGGVLIYECRLHSQGWTNSVPVRDALLAERERPLSLQERRDLYEGYVALSHRLADPLRNASSDDRQLVNQFVKRSRDALSAETFRVAPERVALREFPELEPAYRILTDYGQRSDVKALSDDKRNFALTALRDQIATAVEKGHVIQPLERARPEPVRPSQDPER